MCLYNSNESVKEVLAQAGNLVTCYKFLVKRVKNDKITLMAPYFKFEYKPGETLSDSKRKKACNKTSETIVKGIHVFRNMKDCKEAFYGELGAIVELTALKKDLLGANAKEMVFSKVTLSEQEYKKHMMPKKKKKVKNGS